MKLLMILGLVLGTVVVCRGETARSNEPEESSAVMQRAKSLELTILADRRQYKRHSKIKITVMLTNVDYVKDVFVYRMLGWGHLSSITYTIRNASGKLIHPAALADDLPLPLDRNDETNFVKLAPDHFLGTALAEDLNQLNMNKPGKYSILVEYHCPISRGEVELNNFWSKEDGIIRSNVVHLEVLP